MQYMSSPNTTISFGLLGGAVKSAVKETVDSSVSNGLASGIKEEINNEDANSMIPAPVQDGLASVAGVGTLVAGKGAYGFAKSGMQKGLLNINKYVK